MRKTKYIILSYNISRDIFKYNNIKHKLLREYGEYFK